jgi:hypothetical protein
MLKLVTLQSLAAKCCNGCGKDSPARFANFVLICITRGKMHHIWAESGAFSPCVIQINTKFANFAGLYFPHFTTFRCQTLQFY